MPVREKPSTSPMSSLMTLEKAQCFGRISRLDRARVRAALAMAERSDVADMRRVTGMIIERVGQYYDVVGYCSPRASLAAGQEDLPRAMSADSEEISPGNGRPLHARVAMNTEISAQNVERLWQQAGMISLNLAFDLAAWELTECAPESSVIVMAAAKFGYRICQSAEWSGSRWQDIKRRAGTPLIKRTLKAVKAALPSRWIVIHPQTGHALLMTSEDYSEAAPGLMDKARQFECELRVSAPAANSDQSVSEIAEAA